jgi:multiple sugar transport system substrate-binding protein
MKNRALMRAAAAIALTLSIWGGGHVATAARTNATKPYAGTTITFLSCCPTVAQFVAMQKLTNSSFTPSTGITVKWDTSTPYSALEQKIVSTAVSGNGAYDLVAWPDSWGSAVKPYLLPLNNYVQQAHVNLKDWPQSFITIGSSLDGKQLLGLPFRGHAQLLFYRTDIFKKLGLEAPSTWQQLIADATVIKQKAKIDPLALYYGGLGAGQNLFIWLNMLWSNGGTLLDKNNQPQFDSPAGIQATQLYIDLLRKYHFTQPTALTNDEGGAGTVFQKGQAAMWVGWSWYEELFTNPTASAPAVVKNTAFVPAPGWQGKGRAAYSFTFEASVLQSSKHQAAAFEYLKWLTSASVERQILLNKSDPKTDTVVGEHLSNLRDPQVNAANHGLQQEMASILTHSRSEPLVPQWLKVQSILEIAINKMANGAPVNSTLAQAQKDVATAMKG